MPESESESLNCTECGDDVTRGDCHEIGEQLYCADCATQCDLCDDAVTNDDRRVISQTTLCESCYQDSDNVRSCAHCEDDYLTGEGYRDDDGDNLYCSNHCLEQATEEDEDEDSDDGRFNSEELSTAKVDPTQWNFGAELEATGGKNRATAIDTHSLGAGCCHDGSIKGNGIEVQTPPAPFDEWKTGLKAICRIMLDHGQEVDISCGTHIHISPPQNIKLNFVHLARIYRLFAMAEPLIYSVVSPSRLENHFCYPIITGNIAEKDLRLEAYNRDRETEAHEIIDRYYQTAKPFEKKDLASVQGSYDSNKRSKNHNTRYHGLNLHSYAYRGTLEFRYHNGSLNAEKLSNFALLMKHLADFAIKGKVGVYEPVLRAIAEATTTDDMVKTLLNNGVIPPTLATWTAKRQVQLSDFRAKGRETAELVEDESLSNSGRDSADQSEYKRYREQEIQERERRELIEKGKRAKLETERQEIARANAKGYSLLPYDNGNGLRYWDAVLECFVCECTDESVQSLDGDIYQAIKKEQKRAETWARKNNKTVEIPF